MAIHESPYCPECVEAFDYPEPMPVARRDFLKAGVAAGAALAVGGAAVQAAAPPSRTPRPSEELIRELFSSLKSDQAKRLVYDYDHGLAKNNRNAVPTRMGMYNGPIMNIRIKDVYSKGQQELIEKIVQSMSSGEDGFRQISRLGRWDASGSMDNCGALFFGEPTAGNKFSFVFAGHHLTIRCDGNTEEGPAFGGPIYYGHSPNGWSRGNVFNYQTRAVVNLYKALSGKQQQMALAKHGKNEPKEQAGSVRFRKPEDRPGIPASELSRDQRDLAAEVMRTVLKPYRWEDVDEVMSIIERNGGMEKIKFAFFPDGATDEKEPWHFWRLEGPGFVWNFRVLPHVHTFVNISSKLS